MSKSAKNAQLKQMTSLDEKHQEMLDKFKNNTEIHIPKLKQDVKDKRARIKILPKARIDEILDIKDEIIQHKQLIKQLEGEKNLYLLDNSKFIFDYFESKKQISSGEPAQNIKVLNSFFRVKTTQNNDVNVDKYVQSKKMYQEYWRNVNNEFTNHKIIYCPMIYVIFADKVKWLLRMKRVS